MVTTLRQTDKPKAYFAQFDGASGILTRPGTDVLFFDTETRQYTTITRANAHLLLPLQAVGEWMAVYYEDVARAREERQHLRQTNAA